MSIYIFDGSKSKKTNLTTADEVLDKMKASEIEKPDELEKIVTRGGDVHCYIDPYLYNMSQGEEVINLMVRWDKTESSAKESYYQLMDNV